MRGSRTPRRNKYGSNRHVATVGGQECHFDSMAEHHYADWLERQRLQRRIHRWEHHPRRVEVWDALTDTRLCYLNPDFLVVTAQGDPEYHEVKGMATGLWRMKRRLLETLTAHAYVVIDAGRGVCASGMGEPALFDERPRRTKKRRKRGS